MKRSNEVQWNTTENETFRFLRSAWDVRKAKELIAAKPRKVDEMSISGPAELVGSPVGPTFVMGITVNWSRCESHEVNMDVPVILARRKDGTHMPIDGWHRIAKAKMTGRTTLPCVVLTRKESIQVEI